MTTGVETVKKDSEDGFCWLPDGDDESPTILIESITDRVVLIEY